MTEVKIPRPPDAPVVTNEAELRAALAGCPDGSRLSLRSASLAGASLRQVNLDGVDLSEADLSGAHLARASLREATLESVDLSGSDLANADLRGATLAEATLQKAMCEEANFQGATLRFASAQNAFFENANLEAADLLSANLQNAELAGANLRHAVLEEADLRGADLTNANLEGANLVNAHFEGAKLTGASLIGASVRGANFRGAVLREARLTALDMSSCDLTGAHLSRALLERTQLESGQLGGALGEETLGEYGDAKRGYLALERNFLDLGDQDAARWAYGKRRRMEKLESLAAGRLARREGRYRNASRHYGVYVADQTVEWLCDYGESIPRVFASLIFLYLAFTVLYGVTGSVVRIHTSNGIPATTRDPVDLAIFSLLAMTTSGSPGVGLQPRDEYVYFLSGIQALMGISFTGLLGFVIGNRIRR